MCLLAMPTAMSCWKNLIWCGSMQGGSLSLRSLLWFILPESGHKTQDSKWISTFDSLPNLICGRIRVAALDSVSVDRFSSLKWLKALFVLPKSTVFYPFSSVKGQNMKTVSPIALFCPAVIVHLNMSSFISFYHLCPLLLSGHMLVAPAIVKVEDKNSGARNAESNSIVMEFLLFLTTIILIY